MAGDGFDVRPEVLRSASTAMRDDAERVRLATTSAANALLAAGAAAGAGPLGATLDQVRDEVTRALGESGAEIAENADRLVASASVYQTSDTAGADAVRRALSPDASRS